jgi:hypothetical protein
MECCGSIILIDKKHKIILSTLTALNEDKIFEIIKNKKNIIF